MKPNIIKWIVISVLILIVIIVLFVFVLKGKNAITDAVTESKLIKEANYEIATDQITLTSSQFATLATKIYKAVKGAGTDEDAIYAAFLSVNSRSDVLKLISTFGVRDGMTLKEWLYDDLSTDEITKINDILSSKNILYTF